MLRMIMSSGDAPLLSNEHSSRIVEGVGSTRTRRMVGDLSLILLCVSPTAAQTYSTAIGNIKRDDTTLSLTSMVARAHASSVYEG